MTSIYHAEHAVGAYNVHVYIAIAVCVCVYVCLCVCMRVCVLLAIRGSSWSASTFIFISHKKQDEGNERKQTSNQKALRPLQVGKKTFV